MGSKVFVTPHNSVLELSYEVVEKNVEAGEQLVDGCKRKHCWMATSSSKEVCARVILRDCMRDEPEDANNEDFFNVSCIKTEPQLGK